MHFFIHPSSPRITLAACLCGMLSLLWLMTGCGSLVQEVDPNRFVENPSQLVIHSYLSPQDTVLTVRVGRSQASIGIQQSTSQFNTVSDATVTLSDGNKSVTLTYDAMQSVYRADPSLLPIMVGRTYTLTVRSSDGQQATASTTVPAPVPITSIAYDSATSRATTFAKEYFIRMRWNDPAGMPNYYRFAGYVNYMAVSYEYQGTNQPYKEVPYPAISTLLFYTNGGYSYVDDGNLDGRQLTSSDGYINAFYGRGPAQFKGPIILTAYLLSINADYYRYWHSIDNQVDLESNPFAEPLLVAGNIKGALGCFGAYSRAAFVQQLK